MINEDILKGNINSTERQLLWDIRELLKEQNKLLKSMAPKPQEVIEVKEEIKKEVKQEPIKRTRRSK